MIKKDKKELIDSLTEQLQANANFYLADVSTMNAADTSRLRRMCFNKGIQLRVVKNTLLKKAMEQVDREYNGLDVALKGHTSLMFAETGNAPAKLIKEFRKKSEYPVLKAAFIEDMVYVGDNQLDFLAAIKSKNELIADVVALLQSPVKNVVSALQSGGQKLSGILETLSEKTE
ncbi:MAG: 50S ribosomal protein L10 [Bacteroidales bacterium]|nr:50S ribosomal protein L10 [Bacteroidales bacterium]